LSDSHTHVFAVPRKKKDEDDLVLTKGTHPVPGYSSFGDFDILELCPTQKGKKAAKRKACGGVPDRE
jgi:hypothetical protein